MCCLCSRMLMCLVICNTFHRKILAKSREKVLDILHWESSGNSLFLSVILSVSCHDINSTVTVQSVRTWQTYKSVLNIDQIWMCSLNVFFFFLLLQLKSHVYDRKRVFTSWFVCFDNLVHTTVYFTNHLRVSTCQIHLWTSSSAGGNLPLQYNTITK